ncbi:MAG: hypothetical protein AB1491_05680 [Thermodesulfobacteriota bacterium]
MEINYSQIASKIPNKKKGEVRLGIICSDSNPPNTIEFMRALSAQVAFLIDKVVYAVNDGIHKNQLLLETKNHRYAMAKLATNIYSPLVTFSDIGDMEAETITKTRMQNGIERYRVDGEDYAFKLFGFNQNKHFTLFFMAEERHFTCFDANGNDDTIKKLLTNIKNRCYGFNSNFHKIVALFIVGGNVPPNPKLILDEQEKYLLDSGIFRIEWMEDPYKELGIKENVHIALKDALEGRKPENYILLPHVVYDYIQKNSDYKEKLTCCL